MFNFTHVVDLHFENPFVKERCRTVFGRTLCSGVCQRYGALRY
jgi:hypothetical protein